MRTKLTQPTNNQLALFHDWPCGDFDIQEAPPSRSEAGIIILLLIAIAATGMMVFRIQF